MEQASTNLVLQVALLLEDVGVNKDVMEGWVYLLPVTRAFSEASIAESLFFVNVNSLNFP